MKIIDTSASLPNSITDQLAVYSGMDVLSLFEVKDELLKLLDDNRRSIYDFEMALQSPLLSISLDGMLVDTEARDKMIKEFSEEQDALTKLLNSMLEAVGYFEYYRDMAVLEFSDVTGQEASTLPQDWDEWKGLPLSVRRWYKKNHPEELVKFQAALKAFSEPFNPKSPDQKLKLLYNFFGSPNNEIAKSSYIPPPWLKTHGIPEHKSRNTKGEYTPSSGVDALEKIIKASDGGPDKAAFWAAPFAHIFLAISDLSKSLGFLNCKLENGYFKSSFGTLTETGRLSSRRNAQGFGSNAQNVTPKLRHILIAPPKEKIIAIDYAQIESRIVAAICFRLFGLKNYIAATESGDLHSLAASVVWPEMSWPQDFTLEWTIKHGPFPKDMIKAAKELASIEFYRGKSRRDVSKTLGHGTSYMGKAPQMSKQSHIELTLVRHYQEVFFYLFPEMLMWHQWVVEQVQTVGEITTMLGRTRRFFGRPNDDATIREAVAYEPQSVAADYCNRALLRLHKLNLEGKFPATLRLTKHDELAVTFKEELEKEIIDIMVPQMEERIIISSPSGETREWYVPAEAESGWNLGRFSKKNPELNPNGLSNPLDGRVRVTKKDWREWVL